MGKIVAISGGFDPLHSGHLSLIDGALSLGSSLWVFLNSDAWLIRKKGFCLLPFEERAKVISCAAEGLASHFEEAKIVSVFSVTDLDDTVCATLDLYHPDIFANGGDRDSVMNVPEAKVCKELGIELAFGVGGGGEKRGSSTDYFRKAIESYLHSSKNSVR